MLEVLRHDLSSKMNLHICRSDQVDRPKPLAGFGVGGVFRIVSKDISEFVNNRAEGALKMRPSHGERKNSRRATS